MKEVCSQIRGLHSQFPRSAIWIGGDANLTDIEWDRNVVNDNSYKHVVNQLYLDNILNTSSELVVRFPTHGDETMGVFITNRSSLIYKCKPIPGVSDHDIVFVEAKVLVPRKKLSQTKIYLWKQADLDNMDLKVKAFSPSFTSEYTADTGINTLWSSFKTFCSEAIDSFVPLKMFSSRFHQPWINNKTKRLSRNTF